ncbi:DUF1433 domain-containing protein [Staphylococcus pettenkoferi]|uniref:DUF1433 domain-containing protein n=1 Tax=Staphylococcus pettenkoferi TaxID=170573 RepID=A0ABT4BQP7_9STAP|nr:DUF1433 domain-containing protein [Staphylococcus pettenkoferi]MCY1565282.1 DUF1433 domain-containing protein [Staphylococcus pettenkoferi]MCY1570681.1 DUF1433 domain-containing protein [Staphylococcus pettenkoferi]MCY1584050.1 DUF1433 domain-containing protein [Staphylococcus pettenkoferi]MCY1605944.1 DUF1433 domain-containing protein [Staphylococcus pettenkoferi]MDH9616039.1 DUF1433 domain-containing protein [Staphylococcus pettenkoferi]
MSRKTYIITDVIVLILIIAASCLIYKQNEKEKYYSEQIERITTYMKYNVKDYKSIIFTDFERNPMDGYEITGYINNDKKLEFTAGIRSTENYQFYGDISFTGELSKLLNKNTKSFS